MPFEGTDTLATVVRYGCTCICSKAWALHLVFCAQRGTAGHVGSSLHEAFCLGSLEVLGLVGFSVSGVGGLVQGLGLGPWGLALEFIGVHGPLWVHVGRVFFLNRGLWAVYGFIMAQEFPKLHKTAATPEPLFLSAPRAQSAFFV